MKDPTVAAELRGILRRLEAAGTPRPPPRGTAHRSTDLLSIWLPDGGDLDAWWEQAQSQDRARARSEREEVLESLVRLEDALGLELADDAADCVDAVLDALLRRDVDALLDRLTDDFTWAEPGGELDRLAFRHRVERFVDGWDRDAEIDLRAPLEFVAHDGDALVALDLAVRAVEGGEPRAWRVRALARVVPDGVGARIRRMVPLPEAS